MRLLADRAPTRCYSLSISSLFSPGLSTSTQPGTGTPPDELIRRLTIGFCLVALVLGAFEAWTTRFDMNPDGIQYLDNAAAYRQGDFQNALSTQWSPLYPWLIAALSAVVRPTPEQEFPLVHLLNFAIYALTLAGFLFFLRSVHQLTPAPNRVGLLLLSHSAFLYCSLDFTNLLYVAPDLLVSFFAFLAAGLLVRMAGGSARAIEYAALGATLGLGYLAKAPWLPIGLCCLAMAFILGRKRALWTCALLVAIAAPYIAVLSHSKGRFTFGDSGKLNVAWHVNGLPNTNWQGGPGANGRPIHPTREIATHPAIFEFSTPIAGTYPPWYDPAYWNEGVRVAYHPREFVRAIGRQISLYGYLLHHRQIPLLFALVTLWLLIPDKRHALMQLKPFWPVLVLGAVPFAMYAPIHAEGRYLAPFFVLLWTALFCGVLRDARILSAIAATAALLMFAESGIVTVSPPPDQPPARAHYEIAHQLEILGLRPGDRVAIVTGDLPYYWARLATAHIALQISFDQGYRERQAEWETARKIVADQGVAFVVAPALDGVTDQPGFIPLGTTNVFAYPIRLRGAY